MKALLIGLAAVAILRVGSAHAAPATQPTAVAVVELFTSEGCSSCPPADELVGRLVKEHRPVLALAFHVDYWNRLGWVDPFSAAAYSDRQMAYTHALGLGETYTPQIIVNGTTQCIGSDQQAVDQAIAAALAHPAEVQVGLAIAGAPSGYVATVSVKGKTEGCVLNVAVVERGLSSEVAHGENGGKTLRHENVVRWFKTVPMGVTQVAMDSLPASVRIDQCSVIAYVQHSGQGGIVGGVEAGFSK